MKCESPVCDGKLKVVDSVNAKSNEKYRKRVCDKCGSIVYTVEFPVEEDERFIKTWTDNHRTNSKNRNRK